MIGAILLLLIGSFPALAADYAAVVVRVDGSATLKTRAGPSIPLAGYEGIQASEQLDLGEGARVTIVFPQDGQLEVWAGPGLVRVSEDGGQASQPPPRLEQKIEVDDGLVQAAMDYETFFDRDQVLRVGAGIIRGDLDEAGRRSLEEAQVRARALRDALGPSDPSPLVILGSAWFKLSQPDAALACFEQAAALCPQCEAAVAMRDHLRALAPKPVGTSAGTAASGQPSCL